MHPPPWYMETIPLAPMSMSSHYSFKILMLPWLAHGHISPFLELAKRLSNKSFTIYFCSTPTNLSIIKQKLAENHSQSIQLVEFHLSTLPDLPPHYHTTKSLPPELMPKLKEAFEMTKPNFSNILEKLKPDLVIYDLIQPWVPTTALEHKIPAVLFITTGAAMASFMLHFIKKPDTNFPFPEIYLREYEKGPIAHLKESSRNQEEDKFRLIECMELSCDVILIKTFKEIEGKYVDCLSQMLEKKIVPIGPLVEDNDQGYEDKSSNLMDWLNNKGPFSTLFVSFGSELALSKEDIHELAHALELSYVNFLWVIRFQKGEKMEVQEALPEGFLEKVGDRGIVVEGWAPQAKILGHGSLGGFVSHCGWSSVMEALKFGVPIIAIPIINDEPINARLLVDVGVGLEAVKDKNGGIERTEVTKVIKQVIVEEIDEVLGQKQD